MANRVERYRARLDELRTQVGSGSEAAIQLHSILDALDRYAPQVAPARLTWIWLTDHEARRKRTAARLREAIAQAPDSVRLEALASQTAAATTWHFITGNILCMMFLALMLPLFAVAAVLTGSTVRELVIRRIDPGFIVEKAMAFTPGEK